jgi:heme/copper-type cytochrome/quinol oxidase subunit 2
MEPFQQHTNVPASPLHSSLFAAAKIAGIAAIISLAGSLAGVIATLSVPAPTIAAPDKEGFDEQTMQQLVQSSTYISVFISLAISVLAFYFLFRFSKLAKTAISSSDKNKLSTALQSLAGYFRIWAVIMFLIIVLFVLSLVGGILGGAMGG